MGIYSYIDLHLFIWLCSKNGGLWKASVKNQQTLMAHTKGRNAKPAKFEANRK